MSSPGQDIPHYDAIVVGLGAVGSATLYQLARRGARVLGLDQFAPPHTLGSSHGQTRITRLAVGEGDQYVPLVRRSHEIWAELEAATGQSIYTRTHGLVLGPRDGATARAGKPDDFVRRTIGIAQRHGIAHEVLDTADLRRRYPQFKLRGDEFAYWERDAGFVRPEVAIGAQLQVAQAHGAEVHTHETVLSLEPQGDATVVTTTRGTYRADQVVLAAGAWLPQLVQAGGALHSAPLAGQLGVYRQAMFWFDVGTDTAAFGPAQFPVFIWALGDEEGHSFYGFPAVGPGAPALKIATAQYQATTTPQAVDRTVAPAEADDMLRRYVQPRLNAGQARCTGAHACLYTVSPDHGFVIDRLPGWPGVHVASPCSGHGFKHSAAIGEALALRVLGLPEWADLSAFSAERFVPAGV
ncbi:N-methyl-L-tryptophan oxidase [Acidovorax sp. LjRoot194]|uniref:N-methyl-L-tryptophan oxidase n=1 Tax=Acidovorax sp. LjRoot194 TaxID=3342280 RepID=UPI003ECD8D8C